RDVMPIGDATVPWTAAFATGDVRPVNITVVLRPIHARICVFIGRSFRVGRVGVAAWSVDADFAAHRGVTIAEIRMRFPPHRGTTGEEALWMLRAISPSQGSGLLQGSGGLRAFQLVACS